MSLLIIILGFNFIGDKIMNKDAFYKRVKNSLPCNLADWTDQQVKDNFYRALQRQSSGIEQSFILGMLTSEAHSRGLEL